jgi:hypothetical protein
MTSVFQLPRHVKAKRFPLIVADKYLWQPIVFFTYVRREKSTEVRPKGLWVRRSGTFGNLCDTETTLASRMRARLPPEPSTMTRTVLAAVALASVSLPQDFSSCVREKLSSICDGSLD